MRRSRCAAADETSVSLPGNATMHVSQIHISNFRLFKNLKLDLGPNLNLIVGENNSGKTALVDSIRYALDTNSSEWIRIEESDFRRGETQFSIQLKFDGISARQARVFVEHLTHEPIADGVGRKSVLYLTLSAEITDQINRGRRFIRTELRSGISGSGPTVEREVRNYLSATYLRPLRDAEAELTASRGSRLSQVLHSSKRLKEATNIMALLNALIDANKAILKNEAIKHSVEEIRAQLNQLNFATTPFAPTIEIMGGTDISKLSDAEKKQMCRGILEKLQLLIDQEDRHQGLGYSNLLFMATELLLLEQEQDEFPLLLIEEPEAHLHPQLQMKFLRAIREDFGRIGKPALQSILTTHSPNLASKAPLESIIIMARGKAFPLKSDQTELDRSDYVFLEKFLDVTKSNLFFAKGVLVVEGDGENILLPAIAEILGKPLENYGVSIVNVGSTAYARYAKIFRRKVPASSGPIDCLPVRVVCIRDLDLWPRRAERQGEDDMVGFKVAKAANGQGKGGNESNWLDFYTPETLASYKDGLKKIGGQNVVVEVSDAWTFEFSLARGPLWMLVYEAINGGTNGSEQLPTDAEERAVFIYGMIESKTAGKTSVAYRLAQLLKSKYCPADELATGPETREQTQAREHRNTERTVALQAEFRESLPAYIVRSIDYVTELSETVMYASLPEAQTPNASA
jgi:putative ATP-dependent endonuclease of the OLD family